MYEKINIFYKQKANEGFKSNKHIILIIIVLFLIFNEKVIKTVNIKISIIIPTYNRANLITRSINSVLNQTYTNLEVLVIDDCSTDNTKKEIDKIKDNRIRYIKLRKNKGPNFARNLGIKKSKGEYITFQDSDDIFYNTKLEKQIKNIINNKSDLDFCKIRINLQDGQTFIFPDISQEKRILKKKVFNELSYGNFISTQSILVKKYYIQKYLFDTELPRLQDYDLALRMIPKIKVSYTQEVLVDLFRYNDSIGESKYKIEKAKELLSKKNYGFDTFHKVMFNYSLNRFK